MSTQRTIDVVDGNVENLTIEFNTGIEIPGILRMEGDPPDVKLSAMRVMIQAVESSSAVMPANAAPAEDGKFKLTYVSPSRYRVNAAGGPQGSFVKSIKFAGRDVTEEGLDLSSGSGGSLEILMSLNGAQVSVAVQNENGDPVKGAMVTLAPVKELAGLVNRQRTGMTDQNGNAVVANVPPGEYKVFAWEDPEPGLYEAPEIRKAFEKSAASVKLANKGNESVSLKLIPRDAIETEKAKLQ
jgi:hypothetical protein